MATQEGRAGPREVLWPESSLGLELPPQPPPRPQFSPSPRTTMSSREGGDGREDPDLGRNAAKELWTVEGSDPFLRPGPLFRPCCGDLPSALPERRLLPRLRLDQAPEAAVTQHHTLGA